MNIEDWGLTDKGFYCPTFEEILAGKIKSAKELFGENICTDNNTALGKFIRLETVYDLKLFEEAEKVYYSISPATATGVSLDRAVSFARMARNTATAAVHKIRLYGTVNHMKPKGTLVKSSGGVVFYTTKDCNISEYDGVQNDAEMYYAEVAVQCVDAGTSGNVYDINSLVDVDNDISLVEYVETITPGTNTESDFELLNRYNDVVDGLGTNTKNAIISELMKINGVHDADILENTSDNENVISDDLTVESGKYAVIVYSNSGLDNEIAAAIFKHKPFGIKQNGVEVVTVKDDAEEYHNVKFTYVKEVKANIIIACKVNSEFSSASIDDIKSKITEFINSLSIGKPLIYSRLYEKVYSTPGTTEITNLAVNNDTESIYPMKDEIIRAGTITVTVTEE
ncbi:MAG: baseplate J/gp47 family protein [bacterium]|nr:baseplate J/gp47 family protein [bacterium]